VATKKKYSYQRKYAHNWNQKRSYTVRRGYTTRRPARLHTYASQTSPQRRAKNPSVLKQLRKPSKRNQNFNTVLNTQKLNQPTLRGLICAKRQIRKEVIHAMGRGGSKVRPPQYKPQSQIKC